MDSITSITIPVDNFELQTFTSTDTNLIGNQEVEVVLNTNTDSVEYYLYDQNQQLLEEDYNFIGWQANADSTATDLPDTLKNVNLDPEKDVLNSLPSTGKYYPFYTFVRNKFLSSTNSRFYIDSISGDRKELTVKTNNLTPEQLTSLTEEFLAEVNSAQYFKEFYLNFGENQSIIGLDLRQEEDTLKIKLYLPLPTNFQTKSTFWIQFRVADPIAYEVDYLQILAPEDTTLKLRGPNLNIERKKDSPNSTEYKDKTQLDFTYSTGSRAQLSSLLQEKGIELNVDYTEYSNFVHFSSATQRLQNFYYKVQLIESGSNRINQITGSTMPVGQKSQSIAVLQNEIDEIITNFDGYDYYLYYESGSKAWPKTNSVKPYTLASTGSAEVIAWYGTEGLDGTGQLQSASIYDNGNQDNLVYSTPEFIREDSDNAGYDLFIEMIGQHFDNLYLYTEAITQKYNADNRLDFGVSKDLVADTLRSFGVKLYENNFSTDDLYTALIGLTPSGSTLPLPNISTNFPVTGSGIEYIETIVSASNEVIPLDDLNKSVYKRLYHNLPALVKKKGTLAGLRLLINTYGIPDTILRISEFGGKDKDNSNDWDYWKNVYSEKFELNGTDDFTFTEWALNTDWNAKNDRPAGLAFRFKTDEITTSNPTNVSQSLWWTSTAPPTFTTKYSAITLEYTGSAGTSGSYSGSVVDPYYRYGTLTFFPDYADTTVSASIYLPFFDGGWWSVLVNSGSNGTYTLYAKNSLYNGDTGTELGFQASSSISHSSNTWISGTYSVFGNSVDTYDNLSGSLQELRYYKNAISESVFDDYVMNPNSIEGNSINSSANELIFRGALGAELHTESISIHPKVSGEAITASFASDSNIVFNTGSFTDNKEYYFLDQPAVGIKNRISDKIRLDNNNAYGTVLSNQRSLIQNTPATKKYTRDTNYLEVGFSPQNEINDDIINQIGYFNIGDYIGDPRQISSSLTSYEDLDALRLDYFKKYSKSYDLNDYLRLIKFYDNSLFKMVKDFIPARTGAATGAIIKPTILERNRQRPAQASWTRPEYSASIQPQSRGYETGSIEVFTGGPAGAVNDWIDINQSWTSSILTPEGLVTSIESSEREFYNGEYSGSVIDVVNGKLQDNPLLGEAYRLSTGDLQSLYASLDGNFNGGLTHLDGGFYRGSGSLIFDQLDSEIEYYDTISGDYTPAYTRVSNLQLNISGAYTQVEEDPTLFSFIFNFENLTTGEVLATTTYSYDNGVTFTFDVPFTTSLTLDDFTVDSGSTYGLTWSGYTDAVGDGSGLTVYDTSFTSYRITVADLSKNSKYYNDPTVFAQQNFPGNLERFNDYNAIYNNVYSNRVSNKYFDVDYTNDALNPTNFGPIISQSALYAQIQDSNYDPKSAFFEARFGGTKQTTPDFNEGKEVVAGAQTSYMAYYQYAGSSLAGREGSANFKVLYLIDEEGELIQPNADQSSSYFLNTNQAFTQNSEVDIVTFQSTETETEKFIRETATVYKPLNQVQTVLYSDTGSLDGDYLVNGFYTTMSFELVPGANNRPYDLYVQYTDGPTGSFPAGVDEIVPLSTVNIDKADGFDTSTYKYTVQRTSPLEASFTASCTIENNDTSSAAVTLTVYKDVSGPSVETIGIKTISGVINFQNVIVTGSTYLEEGDEIYMEARANRLFSIENSDLTLDPVLEISAVTTPYWTTGSVTTTVLTSSAELGAAYGEAYRQVPVSGSGFPNPVAFDLQVYDEIRFEGNEEQIYLVTNIEEFTEQDIYLNVTRGIYVTLDRPINTGNINIQYFAIRRNTVNPNFIMIDSNTVRPAGPGFIVPKYPSRQLKNNFDTIVKDFAEKNLI